MNNEVAKNQKQEGSLQKLYEATFKDLKEGQIIKGKIISVGPKEVLVDIGYKSEGIVPIQEFTHPHQLKEGQEIEVVLESKEDDSGGVVVSKLKAQRLKGWEAIVNNYKEGDLIEGKVIKKVKGGFLVDVGGIEAFCPNSLSGLRGDNIGLSGQTYTFKIVKITVSRKNIVLSRKDAILKEREERRTRLFDSLQIGEIKQGVVKNITEFGVFIDLGGVDGLLHITDMSWSRISHPSELVAIGDKIDVVILNVDKQSGKVSLGLKQKTSDPWLDVETKYPVGTKVKGKVVNILPYGAFVELEKGVEGLVHISELSWTKKINNPSEVLAIGDVVEAVVLNVDSPNRRIALGIKQTEADPWLELEKKYPPGSKVKVKIRSFTDFGAFAELEEGIDGLIHISDMSWTKRINHPQDMFKKGQKIEAVVLSVDSGSHKVSLGVKQLTADPWPEIAQRFPAGLALEGTIVKVTSFGLFVQIDEDLEGLVHISEIEKKPQEKLEDLFKVGDKIKVSVLKVDVDAKKIALTAKKL
jgi:small subunit ribosomal protein S1